MKRKGFAFLLAITLAFGNANTVSAAAGSFDITDAEQPLDTASMDSVFDSDIIIIDEEEEEAEDIDESAEDSSSESDSSDDMSTTGESAETIESDFDEFKIPNLTYMEIEGTDDVENPDLSGDASFNSDLYSASSYRTPNLPILRDQSPYGTCWAHSSIALAEISLINKGQATSDLNFSELQLAYFTYNSVVDSLGGTEGDHNGWTTSGMSPVDFEGKYLERGGNLNFSRNVFASWTGATNESTVPYAKAQEVLEFGLKEDYAYNHDAAHLVNYYHAQLSSDSTDIAAVKKLIVDNGAVGVSYNANQDFSYGGSSYHCYNSENNAFYDPLNLGTNHAVTIVGWDDEFSKDNFNITPPGDGAWLVRNSWYAGPQYENSYNGYFWMSYYEGTLSNEAHAFDFVAGNNYENNYQYDGAMMDSWVTGCDRIANVFEVKAGGASEILKAVSFATKDANVDYKVEVYTNLTDDMNPESGELAATKTGNLLYEGYYTIDLDESITVYSGTKFSVVLKFTTADGTVPKYVAESEGQDWYDITADAKAGQSFTCSSYGRWSDYGARNKNNFRIKAFTDNTTSVETTGISFEKNSFSMEVSDEYEPVVNVLPSNATNKQYRLESSDSNIVAVNGTSIVAVAEGTATITAISARGSYKATMTVTVKGDFEISINGLDKVEKGTSTMYVVNTTPTGVDITGKVKFTSSNPSVMTIDEKTGVATAISTGYTQITATVGEKKASMYVSVESHKIELKAKVADDNTITLTWNADKNIEFFELKRSEVISGKTTVLEEKIEPDASGTNSYVDTTYKGKSLDSTLYINYTVRGFEGVSIAIGYVDVTIAKSYKITYEVGKGKNNSANPSTYKYGTAVELKPATPPTGYKFVGWYGDAECTVERKGISAGERQDVTVYAKYSPITYKIRYYANGGTGSMSDTKATYNKSVKLAANKFTYAGYAFNGWNTKADGTGKSYTAGQSVKNLANKSTTVKLYAMWKASNEPVSINIYKSETKVNSKTTKVAVGKSVTLTAKVLNNEGKAADSQKVTYSSSNKEVATVTSAGVVKAVGNGEAVITVKSATKTSVKATTKIRVYTNAKSISLNKTSADMGVSGSEYSLYEVLTPALLPASVNDDNNLPEKSQITWKTNKSSMVKWAKVADSELAGKSAAEIQSILAGLNYVSSSSSGIVTEKGYSLAVMAVKPGEVKVTATEPGKKSASCNIAIHTYVSSLSLKTSTALVKTATGKYSATIKKGKTLTIKPQVSLKGAAYSTSTSTEENRKKTEAYNIAKKYSNGTGVTYKSSNTKVATVSSKGVITAKGKGTATITVKTNDKGKTNTIKVTVK